MTNFTVWIDTPEKYITLIFQRGAEYKFLCLPRTASYCGKLGEIEFKE